jgi:DNA-binding CsgD family transcriptional regulator
VAAGDLSRATKILEEAAAVGEEIGDLVGASAALHGLARLGHAREVASRLAALTAQIEGDLAPARAAHACALTGRDPEALQAVSGVFDGIGAHLLAAEAAADAAGAWRQRDDPRAAAAAERRARILADRCQGATTPSLQAVATGVHLTRAERETALLAAAGHSNKEIAKELWLSVRTVENHLRHVYEKLGVPGRAALADALGTTASPVLHDHSRGQDA